MLLEVINAKYLDDYKVMLEFNDGAKLTVDLENELEGKIFEPLKNKDYFPTFAIKYNTIEWDNGADFAPEYLYKIGLKTNLKIEQSSKYETVAGGKMTTLSDHLDQQYGKPGTPSREIFEEGFEAFKLGARLKELRQEQGLTQQQLADKCNTTRRYISRIENDASDIRLSTLTRIIREGLGGHLKLTIEIK